ncbi:1099_t:CDS:2, partial [Acaulospora colombiana]
LFKRTELSSTLDDNLGSTILPEVLDHNDGEHRPPTDIKLLVQELQKPCPLDTLIKLIRELCDIVTKYTFTDLTEVWTYVGELLSPEKPIEARTIAFQFMISCIRGQPAENLGFLRVIFYDCIKSHNMSEDFELRLLALRELCNDGRNISSFEKNLVKLLSEWVNETVQQLDDRNITKEALSNVSQETNSNSTTSAIVSAVETITETTELDPISHLDNPTRLQSVISLLNHVVKFNFAQFEEHDITRLVEDIAIACKKSTDVSDIACCLDFWDIIVRYGYVPANSLESYVQVLCDKVNQKDVISQKSWHIMRNLLRSHCAYGAIKILCSNLESSEVVTPETTNILRGSVSFLGWATWGSEEVDSLLHTYHFTVLSAMNKSAKIYPDVTVHLEILMQINDLVAKCKNIASLEWEIILNILDNTCYHLLDNDGSGSNVKILDTSIKEPSDLTGIPGFVGAYSKLILQIQLLYMSSSFEGSTSRFISLIQKLRDLASETTIIMLLDYYDSEHALYPSSPDWLVMLVDVVNTFFIAKKTPDIRLKVLTMTIDVYEVTKDVYQEQLVEAVILPMLTGLPGETEIDISAVSMDFLVTVLKDAPPRAKTQYFHSSACKCVTSTHSLIDIFQCYLYKADFPEQSMEVYSEIIKILGDFSAPVDCRLTLLQLLVRMRADNDYRIYFVENIDIMDGAHVLRRDCEIMTGHSLSPTSERSGSSNSATSGAEKKVASKKIERRGSLKETVSQLIKPTSIESRTIREDDPAEASRERLWQIPE